MWTDERDLIMDLLEKYEDEYPAKCPCCDQKDGHIFFYKHEESGRLGSAWVWCSNCKEYSHSRHIIPDWWINMDSVNLEQLHAKPDNLDEIKSKIDAWINKIKNDK